MTFPQQPSAERTVGNTNSLFYLCNVLGFVSLWTCPPGGPSIAMTVSLGVSIPLGILKFSRPMFDLTYLASDVRRPVRQKREQQACQGNVSQDYHWTRGQLQTVDLYTDFRSADSHHSTINFLGSNCPAQLVLRRLNSLDL